MGNEEIRPIIESYEIYQVKVCPGAQLSLNGILHFYIIIHKKTPLERGFNKSCDGLINYF